MWNDWAIYDMKFILGLEATFMRPEENLIRHQSLKEEDITFYHDLATEEGLLLASYEVNYKNIIIKYRKN